MRRSSISSPAGARSTNARRMRSSCSCACFRSVMSWMAIRIVPDVSTLLALNTKCRRPIPGISCSTSKSLMSTFSLPRVL